jgi:hypothetical protein
MTKPKLGKVIKELMDEPMERGYEKRTYRIRKNDDGNLEVTRIPRDHEVARRLELELDEEISNWVNEPTRGRDPAILPVKGSDPPPSDARLNSSSERAKKQSFGPESELEENEPNLRSDHEDVESRRLLKVERRDEDEGNINKKDETYQDQSPTPPPRTPPPNTNPAICPPPMNPPPQLHPLPPPWRAREGAREPRASPNPEPGLFVNYELACFPLPTPPAPYNQRPDLVVAGHLACLPPSTMDPQKHYFVGYGSTIAVKEVDGSHKTYQGNALVQLLASGLPNSGDIQQPFLTNGDRTPRTQPGIQYEGQANNPFWVNSVSVVECPSDRSCQESEAPPHNSVTGGVDVGQVGNMGTHSSEATVSLLLNLRDAFEEAQRDVQTLSNLSNGSPDEPTLKPNLPVKIKVEEESEVRGIPAGDVQPARDTRKEPIKVFSQLPNGLEDPKKRTVKDIPATRLPKLAPSDEPMVVMDLAGDSNSDLPELVYPSDSNYN